jgi:hypothetical protein
MSPFSTIRSGCWARIRASAATATFVSSGESAVNWTSERVAKLQSTFLSLLPSAENSGSDLSGSCSGSVISEGTSASTPPNTKLPAFCWSAAVLMPWNEFQRIGYVAVDGIVNVTYCHGSFAPTPSGSRPVPYRPCDLFGLALSQKPAYVRPDGTKMSDLTLIRTRSG